MRSHDKGSMSATTKVKVLSLEIIHVALGQGFHILETNIGTHAKGECVTDVSGSKSVSVVGLTHSRGVGRVMLVESRSFGTLEGVSSLTQREEVCHAIH